jgi:hypothetical protein
VYLEEIMRSWPDLDQVMRAEDSTDGAMRTEPTTGWTSVAPARWDGYDVPRLPCLPGTSRLAMHR